MPKILVKAKCIIQGWSLTNSQSIYTLKALKMMDGSAGIIGTCFEVVLAPQSEDDLYMQELARKNEIIEMTFSANSEDRIELPKYQTIEEFFVRNCPQGNIDALTLSEAVHLLSEYKELYKNA